MRWWLVGTLYGGKKRFWELARMTLSHGGTTYDLESEMICGGKTLQMGQLVKPKLILGPLHREVNTALY